MIVTELLYPVAIMLFALQSHSFRDSLGTFVFFFTFVFMPSFWGVSYLLVCLITTVWAWCNQGPFFRRIPFMLMAATLSTLLWITYDVWWHATSQPQFQYYS